MVCGNEQLAMNNEDALGLKTAHNFIPGSSPSSLSEPCAAVRAHQFSFPWRPLRAWREGLMNEKLGMRKIRGCASIDGHADFHS